MTEIDIDMGYGIGYIPENGRVTDLSGGCPHVPEHLLYFEYENKPTNQQRLLYGTACRHALLRQALQKEE